MNELGISDKGITFTSGCVDCFEKNDTLWFKLSDIAKVLEVGKNTASMWKDFADKDEIEFKKNELGGHPIPYASESLLYRILNRSNSPKARPFERWITKTVIPSIRKNGGYINNQENLTPEQVVANALIVANKIIEDMKKRAEIAETTLDRIANGNGCFSMAQTAKALKLPYGSVKLYERLRNEGILRQDNSPMQDQVNAGHFKVIVKYINEKVGNKPVTLTTSKGLVYLAKKFKTGIDESVAADVTFTKETA